MENLSTKDFFKGLISHSVDKGTLKVWSPYGVRVAQPFEKNSSSDEMQAILYTIESENGQKFYVAMSKDGEKCAISNDELMAYELYWSAEQPAEYDGVQLNTNTNLERWKQPTVQVAEGTVGFVIDQNDNGKYVNATTRHTQYLPKLNFPEALERISQELQEYQESIPSMPGRKDSRESLMRTYQNSIKNMASLSDIVKKIERSYEENEIKENMSLKAKLTEELAALDFQIAVIENDIKNGRYTFENTAKIKLADIQEKRNTKFKEIQSQFRKFYSGRQ